MSEFAPNPERIARVLANNESFLRMLAQQLPSYNPQELQLQTLARGEYNANFLIGSSQKQLVVRIPLASQMGLANQAAYEARALELLGASGRTPQLYFVADPAPEFPLGLLVEEYFEGRPLNYERDVLEAAHVLADVHCTPLPTEPHSQPHSKPAQPQLKCPGNPYVDMLAECTHMAAIYFSWPQVDPRVATRIRDLMNYAHTLVAQYSAHPWPQRQNIVNTEVNSTNFIILANGSGRLVDWEKPLVAEAEQDLAHFMAPTTTLWRNTYSMADKDLRSFSSAYWEHVAGRLTRDGFATRMACYLPLNCLRGVSWSAMAWTQHHTGERPLPRQDVLNSIASYLDVHFLDELIGRFCNRTALEKLFSLRCPTHVHTKINPTRGVPRGWVYRHFER